VAEGERQAPIAIPGTMSFTTIAASASATCGVASTGSYCLGITWLANQQGPDPLPRRIPGESDHPFRTISAGSFHFCAIDQKGGGWCWGIGRAGEVGAGDGSFPPEPLQLRFQ